MVGLLGPSGTGKTTLLRLINGAIRPTGGSLRVLGQDVGTLKGAALRTHRRRVATIAQQHSLVPRATALHNILLGRLGHVPLWQALWSAAIPSAAERQAALSVVSRLGLPDVLDVPVDLLSGGQQQRIAVARALLHGGEIVLADEPVASVDQETAHLILETLRRLALEEQRTVLVSLHQRAFALRYCTRLVTLDHGTIVYDGPPSAAAWSALPHGSSASNDEWELPDERRREAAGARHLEHLARARFFAGDDEGRGTKDERPVARRPAAPIPSGARGRDRSRLFVLRQRSSTGVFGAGAP